MKEKFTAFIDFFYPVFKRFMPLQTYRYAVCGGSNMLLDLLIYFLSYHFLFHKEVFDLGFIAFEPYIAAFLTAFIITFPTGFWMSKYIVWTSSNLKGRIQLFRYFLLVLTNFFLNYFFLKLFIEYFGFYPTPAKILTIVLVVAYSYLSQKHFTFKVKKVKE